jgi:hypothetical protein
LEFLEDRRLLACAVTQTGATVAIAASGKALIDITDTGTGAAHNVKVKCGNGSTFTSGTVPVTEILIRTGPGVDHIIYNLTGDASTPMTVALQSGAGRNAFEAHLNGHQLLAGANYDFDLHGGVGATNLLFTADDEVHIASAASLQVTEQGGTGRNVLAASYRGKLEGALTFGLEGGRGANSVDSVIDLLAGSTGTVHNSTLSSGGRGVSGI